jgi:hypothetical protein
MDAVEEDRVSQSGSSYLVFLVTPGEPAALGTRWRSLPNSLIASAFSVIVSVTVMQPCPYSPARTVGRPEAPYQSIA